LKLIGINFAISYKKNERSYAKKIDNLICKMSNNLNKAIKENKKIIIFFDELDRCSPQTTLELLTGMKQILFKLKVPNVFFCATINKWQVDDLLTNKNSKDQSYIEKIFYKTYDFESDVEC
jgi:predicted KAP-like P-loop ATPase